MRTRTCFLALPVTLGVVSLLALTSCASRADKATSAVSVPAMTSAAAGGTSHSAPASLSPSAAKPTRTQACTVTQIAIGLTHTGAVTGEEGGYLTFTNRSSVTCELTGWPAVDGVTQAGKTDPVARATSTMLGGWQAAPPEPVVTPAPGDSAYAVVEGDDNPAGNAKSCPAPYARLKVTIPGGTSAATVSAWLPGDDAYLPACTTINGAPGDGVSEIVPLSSLPH